MNRARMMTLAACLTMTLTACAPSNKPAVTLPPRALVVPEPTPLPPVRRCAESKNDLRCALVMAGQNRAAAADNIRKLEQAGAAYDALVKEIEGPKE